MNIIKATHVFSGAMGLGIMGTSITPDTLQDQCIYDLFYGFGASSDPTQEQYYPIGNMLADKHWYFRSARNNTTSTTHFGVYCTVELSIITNNNYQRSGMGPNDKATIFHPNVLSVYDL